VGAHGVLVSKLDKSRRKAVARLFATAAAGRLLVQSEWILEDISSAITSWLAQLGTQEHVLAQVQSLVCALRQIRRHVLWHATATGPHVLNRRDCWGPPSGLAKLRLRGKKGQLTTTLQDEDGSILCTFACESDSQSKRFSWPQDVKVLQGNYEKALFETWSYETGIPVSPPTEASASPAHWHIGTVESSYLEFVSQRTEMLISALGRHAPCERLVAAIGKILKAGEDGRNQGRIHWTYVREIDVMIQKLESTWRQPPPNGTKP